MRALVCLPKHIKYHTSTWSICRNKTAKYHFPKATAMQGDLLSILYLQVVRYKNMHQYYACYRVIALIFSGQFSFITTVNSFPLPIVNSYSDVTEALNQPNNSPFINGYPENTPLQSMLPRSAGLSLVPTAPTDEWIASLLQDRHQVGESNYDLDTIGKSDDFKVPNNNFNYGLQRRSLSQPFEPIPKPMAYTMAAERPRSHMVGVSRNYKYSDKDSKDSKEPVLKAFSRKKKCKKCGRKKGPKNYQKKSSKEIYSHSNPDPGKGGKEPNERSILVAIKMGNEKAPIPYSNNNMKSHGKTPQKFRPGRLQLNREEKNTVTPKIKARESKSKEDGNEDGSVEYSKTPVYYESKQNQDSSVSPDMPNHRQPYQQNAPQNQPGSTAMTNQPGSSAASPNNNDQVQNNQPVASNGNEEQNNPQGQQNKQEPPGLDTDIGNEEGNNDQGPPAEPNNKPAPQNNQQAPQNNQQGTPTEVENGKKLFSLNNDEDIIKNKPLTEDKGKVENDQNEKPVGLKSDKDKVMTTKDEQGTPTEGKSKVENDKEKLSSLDSDNDKEDEPDETEEDTDKQGVKTKPGKTPAVENKTNPGKTPADEKKNGNNDPELSGALKN